MCYILGQLIEHAVARRSLSAEVCAASEQFGNYPSAEGIVQQYGRIAEAKSDARPFRTRLILLGTSGGATYWTNTNRRSPSSAIVVGDAVYVVDCGDGAGKRLQEALASPNNLTMFSNVRALFLTHLHSDHVVDYPNLLLYGWLSGLDRAASPLKVFGPGRRGEMEPVFSLRADIADTPKVVNPRNPTPGTRDMTEYLFRAYATDINDRIRYNGKQDLRAFVRAHDIELPQIPGFSSPNLTPHPDMEPFEIYEDDRVRVSATLVQHSPIWPAFAFRFETDDGAVVFSGDTGPSNNLIKLAKGVNILVHEVIVSEWINRVLPEPRTPAQEAMWQHSLNAHTPVEEVGKIAETAQVSTLVLNHIVPGNARAEDLARAQHGFSGQVVIGEDLLQLGVGGNQHRR
jgi:ribonuclease BN (tRNA processing enzyme)